VGSKKGSSIIQGYIFFVLFSTVYQYQKKQMEKHTKQNTNTKTQMKQTKQQQ